MAPDQIRAMLRALLSRVDVRSDRVEINILRCRLVELLERFDRFEHASRQARQRV